MADVFYRVRAERLGKEGAKITVKITDGPRGEPIRNGLVYLVHAQNKLEGKEKFGQWKADDKGKIVLELADFREGDLFAVHSHGSRRMGKRLFFPDVVKKVGGAVLETDPFLNITALPLNGKEFARVVAWATQKKNGGGVIKNYRFHLEKNGTMIVGEDDWDEEKGFLVDKTGRVTVKLSLNPGDNVFGVYDAVTGVRVQAPTIAVPIKEPEVPVVTSVDLKESGDPGNFRVDVRVLANIVPGKRSLLIVHGSKKERKKTDERGYISFRAKFKEPEMRYRVVDEDSGKEAEIWLYN